MAASLAVLLAAVAAPTGAAADVTASDGTNVLTSSAALEPSRHRGAALRLRFDVARVDGTRPLGFSGIRFDLPAGARFDPRAVARCRQRTLSRAGGVDVRRCPRGSVIGSGVVHIDARPLLTERVVADATLINGLAERGNSDERFSPPREAIFLAAEALGVQALFVATYERGGRSVLVDLGGPVLSPDPFTITGLELRLPRAGTRRRPFLRAPSTCSRPWLLSVAYLFASPLVARDRISARCPRRPGAQARSIV
jgi:hypothetical protein